MTRTELIAEFYEVASGMRTRAFNNVTVKSSTLEMFASEVDALTTKLADMLEADGKAAQVALDALGTCRIMGVDADGNYTREITPKVITKAIASLKEALS